MRNIQWTQGSHQHLQITSKPSGISYELVKHVFRHHIKLKSRSRLNLHALKRASKRHRMTVSAKTSWGTRVQMGRPTHLICLVALSGHECVEHLSLLSGNRLRWRLSDAFCSGTLEGPWPFIFRALHDATVRFTAKASSHQKHNSNEVYSHLTPHETITYSKISVRI